MHGLIYHVLFVALGARMCSVGMCVLKDHFDRFQTASARILAGRAHIKIV
jgi:hypothetical protein